MVSFARICVCVCLLARFCVRCHCVLQPSRDLGWGVATAAADWSTGLGGGEVGAGFWRPLKRRRWWFALARTAATASTVTGIALRVSDGGGSRRRRRQLRLGRDQALFHALLLLHAPVLEPDLHLKTSSNAQSTLFVSARVRWTHIFVLDMCTSTFCNNSINSNSDLWAHFSAKPGKAETSTQLELGYQLLFRN